MKDIQYQKVIAAIALYNLFREKFVVDNEVLSDSLFFYIEKMPRMHRTIWMEEALIILVPVGTADQSDYVECSNMPANDGTYNTKGVYFASWDQETDHVSVLKRVIQNAADHLEITDQLMPHYYQVDIGNELETKTERPLP